MLSEETQAAIRARLRAGFSDLVGFEVIELGEGEATVGLTVEPRHLNPGGIAHGGIAATLLDSAIGLALRTLLPEGAKHATFQLQVTYLRSVSAGPIRARGKAIHAGGRVEYGEGEVVDGTGALLARGTASFVVLKPGSTTRRSPQDPSGAPEPG